MLNWAVQISAAMASTDLAASANVAMLFCLASECRYMTEKSLPILAVSMAPVISAPAYLPRSARSSVTIFDSSSSFVFNLPCRHQCRASNAAQRQIYICRVWSAGPDAPARFDEMSMSFFLAVFRKSMAIPGVDDRSATDDRSRSPTDGPRRTHDCSAWPNPAGTAGVLQPQVQSAQRFPACAPSRRSSRWPLGCSSLSPEIGSSHRTGCGSSRDCGRAPLGGDLQLALAGALQLPLNGNLQPTVLGGLQLATTLVPGTPDASVGAGFRDDVELDQRLY